MGKDASSGSFDCAVACAPPSLRKTEGEIVVPDLRAEPVDSGAEGFCRRRGSVAVWSEAMLTKDDLAVSRPRGERPATGADRLLGVNAQWRFWSEATETKVR